MERELVVIVEGGCVTGIWTDSRDKFSVTILDMDDLKADGLTEAERTKEFLKCTDQKLMLY